jgi:transaldolase
VGADVMTAPPKVIFQMATHALTDKGLAAFMKDWESTGQSVL